MLHENRTNRTNRTNRIESNRIAFITNLVIITAINLKILEIFRNSTLLQMPSGYNSESFRNPLCIDVCMYVWMVLHSIGIFPTTCTIYSYIYMYHPFLGIALPIQHVHSIGQLMNWWIFKLLVIHRVAIDFLPFNHHRHPNPSLLQPRYSILDSRFIRHFHELFIDFKVDSVFYTLAGMIFHLSWLTMMAMT